jgi:hypothetical protein
LGRALPGDVADDAPVWSIRRDERAKARLVLRNPNQLDHQTRVSASQAITFPPRSRNHYRLAGGEQSAAITSSGQSNCANALGEWYLIEFSHASARHLFDARRWYCGFFGSRSMMTRYCL